MKKTKLSFPEHVVYHTQLPVSIYHINYGRHLGHDHLVSLLHEARLRYLSKFRFNEIDIENRKMVVIYLEVFYKKPAYYGDELNISIAINELKNTRLELLYLVKNQKNLEISRARTLHAFLDKEGNVVSVPEFFAEQLMEKNK